MARPVGQGGCRPTGEVGTGFRFERAGPLPRGDLGAPLGLPGAAGGGAVGEVGGEVAEGEAGGVGGHGNQAGGG
jgi:hypothetical protein